MPCNAEPTWSMPMSSQRTPHRSTSRRTAVSAMVTTSSSSSHADHSRIIRPSVYLPGTPCAASSSAASTTCLWVESTRPLFQRATRAHLLRLLIRLGLPSVVEGACWASRQRDRADVALSPSKCPFQPAWRAAACRPRGHEFPRHAKRKRRAYSAGQLARMWGPLRPARMRAAAEPPRPQHAPRPPPSRLVLQQRTEEGQHRARRAAARARHAQPLHPSRARARWRPPSWRMPPPPLARSGRLRFGRSVAAHAACRRRAAAAASTRTVAPAPPRPPPPRMPAPSPPPRPHSRVPCARTQRRRRHGAWPAPDGRSVRRRRAAWCQR
eukprot:scaffold88289_cov64-Phaeocystis_antarctica.AAC.1